MRWLGLGRRPVQQDPDRQAELRHDLRQRFGAHAPVRFADQADAIIGLLDGDDGLSVAVEILREAADTAQAALVAQVVELHRRTGRGFPVDRRNYRPLWKAAGPELQWPLFAPQGGLHPYIQVTAAVAVIGAQARRVVRVTRPEPVVAHLFEVLDLTLVGWEFARVRVDVDAATLAGRLISAARDLNAAIGDPPPLPPPVRELMRRNNTVDVYGPFGNQIVGAFNPGKTMRESLLA